MNTAAIRLPPETIRRAAAADYVEVIRMVSLGEGRLMEVERAAASSSNRVRLASRAAIVGLDRAEADALAAHAATQTAFLQSIGSAFDVLLPRMVPLLPNQVVAIQVGGYYAGEVAEAVAIPAARLSLQSDDLTTRKVAAVMTASAELLRQPGASALIEKTLTDGLRVGMDKVFADFLLSIASPESASNDSVADIDTLLAGLTPRGAGSLGFLAPISVAKQMATLRSSSGTRLWPELAADGSGSIAGIPVVAVADAALAGVILVDAARLGGHIGQIEITASKNADIVMDDAPEIGDGERLAGRPAGRRDDDLDVCDRRGRDPRRQIVWPRLVGGRRGRRDHRPQLRAAGRMTGGRPAAAGLGATRRPVGAARIGLPRAANPAGASRSGAQKPRRLPALSRALDRGRRGPAMNVDQASEQSYAAVADFVARAIGPLLRRIEELEKRGPACEWKGVYQPGSRYDPGHLATCDGCLWLAKAVTRSKPGGGNPCWTMVTKSHR
jgi:hypothetical protein